VLEWLRGQASAGIVAYHGDDRFELPTELGTLLADEDHLDYLGHVFESIPQTFAMIERMPEVFRTGIGLSWDDRGEEAAERIEKAFRNWYRQILVPKALPQLDGIVPRLSSGAKVADIGCGAGIALIEMARAFPHSDFHGYDDSEHALARAVANREAAAATKVSFHNVAAEPLPDDGSFYLICTLDVLHDLTRPDEVASVIRRAIAPDGVWFIADVDCGATFEDNLQNPLAPMFYSASIFGCLSSGLSEPGGAGLGTAGLPEPKMRDLVTRAGFTRFRRLDLPSPINAYYEARA
jgi:2-polyprenyl-3-methyl-5-hydroxy-6-metoxy-1,4-benzoquinol methylase